MEVNKILLLLYLRFRPQVFGTCLRCLSVCLSVCKHDNSKNKWSRILKFEYIVGYEKCSDEFDIGHCPIKVKVTV